MRRLARFVVFASLCGGVTFAQGPDSLRSPTTIPERWFPESFRGVMGVQVISYDTLNHRSAAYYEALAQVAFTEFSIEPFPLQLVIVFIDSLLRARLCERNPDWFQGKWIGKLLYPRVMLQFGPVESDGTFVHELLHLFDELGVALSDVPERDEEMVITRLEQIFLASRGYLEFLRKH